MPYLISKGISWLVQLKNGKKQENKEEPTRWTKFVRATALSLILWNIYCGIIAQPPNIFQKYQVPLESPGFEMRNAFKRYSAEESAKCPGFAEMLQQRQRHVNDELEGPKSEKEVFTLHLEHEISYIKMRNLMVSLKSKQQRAVYFKFGEKALIGCDYCTEDLDYFLFILPEVLSSYIWYIVILGLLTSCRTKTRWLPLGLVALAVLFAVEILVHFGTNLVQPDLYDLFFPRAAADALRYQKMDFVRRLFLVIFTAVPLLFNNSAEEEISDRLGMLVRSAAGILHRLHATRLQRVAVLQDAELRKQYTEHYKNKELLRGLHSSTPEYQSHQRELLNRYNLDSLVKEATDFVDKLYENADESVNSPLNKKND